MYCRKCPKCNKRWYSESEKALYKCQHCFAPLYPEDDVKVNDYNKGKEFAEKVTKDARVMIGSNKLFAGIREQKEEKSPLLKAFDILLGEEGKGT